MENPQKNFKLVTEKKARELSPKLNSVLNQIDQGNTGNKIDTSNDLNGQMSKIGIPGFPYPNNKRNIGTGYRERDMVDLELDQYDNGLVPSVIPDVLENKKPRKGRRKDGTKYLMQYRWRCTFRDAYYVCRLLWPYAHTKLPKIQQVIEHYAKDVLMNGKVINLEEYKKAMSLE